MGTILIINVGNVGNVGTSVPTVPTRGGGEVLLSGPPVTSSKGQVFNKKAIYLMSLKDYIMIHFL